MTYDNLSCAHTQKSGDSGTYQHHTHTVAVAVAVAMAQLFEDMRLARPTVLHAVPQIWNELFQRFESYLAGKFRDAGIPFDYTNYGQDARKQELVKSATNDAYHWLGGRVKVRGRPCLSTEREQVHLIEMPGSSLLLEVPQARLESSTGYARVSGTRWFVIRTARPSAARSQPTIRFVTPWNLSSSTGMYVPPQAWLHRS